MERRSRREFRLWLDRARNADGLRRSFEAVTNAPAIDAGPDKPNDIAPLLRRLLEDYSATGLPPAYLPQITHEEEKEKS